MRVLLVEDDKMIGAAISEALKDAAYAIDWHWLGRTHTEADNRSRPVATTAAVSISSRRTG